MSGQESNGDLKERGLFFKERIYPVLFMALATVVCIGSVSGVYLSSESLILLNETLEFKRSVLNAAQLAPPEDGFEVERLYNQRVTEVETDGSSHFLVSDENGLQVGWVVVSTGPGLWGEIEAVVGYNLEGTRMTGIEFTKQNETPGLGARITEPWFKEQFQGKRFPVSISTPGTGQQDDEFDAVTGATRTSNAVLTLVNSAADQIQSITHGGKE